MTDIVQLPFRVAAPADIAEVPLCAITAQVPTAVTVRVPSVATVQVPPAATAQAWYANTVIPVPPRTTATAPAAALSATTIVR